MPPSSCCPRAAVPLACRPAAQLLRGLAEDEQLLGDLDSLDAVALLRSPDVPLADCLTLLQRQAPRNNKGALLAHCSSSWQTDADSQHLWASQLFFLRGFSHRAFQALRSIAAEQAGALGDATAQAALQAAASLTLRAARVGLLGRRGGQVVYKTRWGLPSACVVQRRYNGCWDADTCPQQP